MESVDIRLMKFDISKIEANAFCLIMGKRRTGKSWLIKDILSHKSGLFSSGHVISCTDSIGKTYSQFAPQVTIDEGFDRKEVADLLSGYHKLAQERQKQNSFLIIDTLMGGPKDWDALAPAFINGRQYRLFVAVTMQYPEGLKPALRLNVDYVFIGCEQIRDNRDKIYKLWAGIFPTFDAFNTVMNNMTPYDFLVIDNTVPSNKLEDIVSWYRAPSTI